jgi:hypothetical protein
MPEHVVTTGRPGPSILVIGDSFTERCFPIMIAQHLSRAIWVDYQECGFETKVIDKFHPDEVRWVPNERYLICGQLGFWPMSLAG